MDAAQKRFASEHGASAASVFRFAWLSAEYVRCSEHAMNGDVFPGVDRRDKSACAEQWQRLADRCGEEMEEIAVGWGFHHLDFGVGLYPTLQYGEGDCRGTVMFPIDCNRTKQERRGR